MIYKRFLLVLGLLTVFGVGSMAFEGTAAAEASKKVSSKAVERCKAGGRRSGKALSVRKNSNGSYDILNVKPQHKKLLNLVAKSRSGKAGVSAQEGEEGDDFEFCADGETSTWTCSCYAEGSDPEMEGDHCQDDCEETVTCSGGSFPPLSCSCCGS